MASNFFLCNFLDLILSLKWFLVLRDLILDIFKVSQFPIHVRRVRWKKVRFLNFFSKIYKTLLEDVELEFGMLGTKYVPKNAQNRSILYVLNILFFYLTSLKCLEKKLQLIRFFLLSNFGCLFSWSINHQKSRFLLVFGAIF